jgi:hypothetical protein
MFGTPRASGPWSCSSIASDVVCRWSICQSGVVQRVVRPGRDVVHLAVCVVRLSGDQETLALGRLLILVFAGLGEFDGEEGSDAGVQVERFAGPAGSDDAGIGMMEAVHLG